MNLLQMERFAEDAFRVKKTYIDIADGDINAGILLGQIVYWYMPGRDGQQKLSVEMDGKLWLVKGREDWHEEIRLSPKQYDRAVKILKDLDLVEIRRTHFKNRNMTHLYLDLEELERRVLAKLTDGEVRTSRSGNFEVPHRGNSSIRERSITTETTAQTTARAGAREKPAAASAAPASESDVMDAFAVAFSRQPNAFQLEKITGHLDDGLEPALLIEIFKQTALVGAQFNYADTALCRIYRQGIRTLSDYQQAEQKRRGRNDARDRRDPGGTSKESGNAYKPEQRDFSDVDLDDL